MAVLLGSSSTHLTMLLHRLRSLLLRWAVCPSKMEQTDTDTSQIYYFLQEKNNRLVWGIIVQSCRPLGKASFAEMAETATTKSLVSQSLVSRVHHCTWLSEYYITIDVIGDQDLHPMHVTMNILQTQTQTPLTSAGKRCVKFAGQQRP